MTHECLVLWVHANELLADASFNLSNAAKHLFLDAKLSLSRHSVARSVQNRCRCKSNDIKHIQSLKSSMKHDGRLIRLPRAFGVNGCKRTGTNRENDCASERETSA